MGIDKRLKFLIFFIICIFISKSVFALSICTEKDAGEFVEFLETATCDSSNDDWAEKCGSTKCYYGSGLCMGAINKACIKLLEETYTETIKQAKSIKYEDYDDYNNEEGSEEERLKNSQESWIKYRETHCKVNVDFSGSGSRLGYTWCLVKENEKRIKELQKYYAPRKEGEIF